MNKQATICAALNDIVAAIAKLHQTFPHKHFAIDGRLVGDIGEIIAELYYDVDLYGVQRPLHDGESSVSDGAKKVQVKATFKESLTFKGKPDYYLGLKLFKNGHHEEIFNGPGRIIYRHFRHRAGIGEKQLSFPIDELRILSKAIPQSDRIKRRPLPCPL
ncbi:MAG: hypothetical protein V1737_03255 [Chloroflexota bacterium]